MSENLKMYIGGCGLVALFAVLSFWITEFRMVAAAQFGALVGAAAMQMTGNKSQ